MLDKNGNKLLKPSPLKMGIGSFLFGDNSGRNQAKKDMKASLKALDGMTADLMEIDVSNP